jgi:beta-galactosidase
MKVILPCAVILTSLLSVVFAQPPKFDQVLYGVAYYQESMPNDRLAEDVRLMKDAGINVVRVGESTWSLWEPEDGRFEYAWMDRIIDAMHNAGIKVILGTPTYSIPAWLYHKHPEILAEYQGGNKAYYGIRQNMDITNPTYLFYAERVIRKIMEHYANHPAIIGYQVDNETTTYGADNRDFFLGFVDYMKKKFHSTQDVNRLWGLNYWGMTINNWDEFPERDGATNPSYKLEWERYKRKVISDYLNWQVSIIKEYKKPNQFVTHDFMPAVVDVDQKESSKNMECLALNIYHNMQDDLNGESIAMYGDYFRSIKHTNYLVTETDAQTTGWDSKWQTPPYDGQLRLCVYSHLASGANMVEYWHWHSIHWGQETYWKGVLSHDLQPNRAYREVSVIAHELQKIGAELVNLKPVNKVAILYSHDAQQGINFMPFNNTPNTYQHEFAEQMHKVLYHHGVGSDFIFPQDNNFNDYALILIPPLYIASDELLEKIRDFVKNGGHVIMCLKSGFCDENSKVRDSLMPGPLREVCGFHYQEFSSIKELSLKDNPFGVETGNNQVKYWAEFLVPETAKPLAFYDHPHFGIYPAITYNKFGKGSLTYEGTSLSFELQEKIITGKLKELGLLDQDEAVKWPVTVRKGFNGKGNLITYYLNFSDQVHEAVYKGKGGINLIAGNGISPDQKFKIDPWGVVIVSEKP